MNNNLKILILGGAGFIGSNLAESFYRMHYKVTVIDGLLGKTGGRKKNLDNLQTRIKILYNKIEDVENLQELILEADLIIDCMAWTSHNAAIDDPYYDLKLNCESHLYVLKLLKECEEKKIIFLSTRGVYGNTKVNQITEETETVPEDIQGIHKLTSENYYRFYTNHYGFSTVVLRVPNCFGKNQPLEGDDIGLIGGFIRDSLNDINIEVFGNIRTRNFIYVGDLANAVVKIASKEWKNFNVYNVNGFKNLSLNLLRRLSQ